MKGYFSARGAGLIALVIISLLCIMPVAFAKDKPCEFGSAGSKGYVNVGDQAPDFTVPVINAPGTFTLYDWKGHIIFINFWTEW